MNETANQFLTAQQLLEKFNMIGLEAWTVENVELLFEAHILEGKKEEGVILISVNSFERILDFIKTQQDDPDFFEKQK